MADHQPDGLWYCAGFTAVDVLAHGTMGHVIATGIVLGLRVSVVFSPSWGFPSFCAIKSEYMQTHPVAGTQCMKAFAHVVAWAFCRQVSAWPMLCLASQPCLLYADRQLKKVPVQEIFQPQ